MDALPDILKRGLRQPGVDAAAWCVAFSGGRDSTVLLHALRQLAPAAPVRAIHIHHGLHADADQWAEHCRRLCARWEVPFELVALAPEALELPGGLEAAAREARYQALREQLAAGEVLLTAHHLDDQLETVLLRLMRGGGPAGVAGIRPLQGFGPGHLLRPLLAAGASQIADYAAAHQLEWVEDSSNQDSDFDRNYIRLEIVPRLKLRWPGAAEAAARTARLGEEASELLHALARIDGEELESGNSLDLARLRTLAPARQRNLVRDFLQQRGLTPPGEAALREGLTQLLHARADAAPRMSWAGGELRRYRQQLFLLRGHPDQAGVPAPVDWNGQAPLDLGPVAGSLHMQHAAPAAEAAWRIRFRAGGERLHHHGHHVSLKNLFQQGGIVPWMRPHVPLVYHGEELVSVGAIWFADNWQQGPARALRWQPREALR